MAGLIIPHFESCAIDTNALCVFLLLNYLDEIWGTPKTYEDLEKRETEYRKIKIEQKNSKVIELSDLERLFGKPRKYYTTHFVFQEVDYILKRDYIKDDTHKHILSKGMNYFETCNVDEFVDGDYEFIIPLFNKYNPNENRNNKGKSHYENPIFSYGFADISVFHLARKKRIPLLTFDTRLEDLVRDYYNDVKIISYRTMSND